jgi:hypothetical protein
LTELGHWLSKTGKFSKNLRSYAWNQVGKMELSAWWTAWFSDSILSKVAMALRKIPLSAAATERNWSIRGAIHSKSRNRLKVSTASQMTFIKQNSLIKHADLFKLKQKTAVSSSSSLESFAENNENDNIIEEIIENNDNLCNNHFNDEWSRDFEDFNIN